MVLLTLSYGILNIIELANFGKSTIRLDVINYHFTEFDVFDTDKKPGLNIAFGITHYDSLFQKDVESTYQHRFVSVNIIT